MLSDVPSGFDVREFCRGIYFFQSWEIFPGFLIDGPKSVEGTFDRLNFPRDLTGKRVLEIAPWNGFFAFECVRRGAEQVVAIGPEDPNLTGFAKTRELLKVENVRYIRDTVYNISKYDLGKFDIVLFLGIVYHLRHPLLALDLLYDHCDDLIFVDSPTVDTGSLVIDLKTDCAPRRKGLLDKFRRKRESINPWKMVQSHSILYFSNEDEQRVLRDTFNWFIPNERSLRDFIISSGFVVENFLGEPDFAYVRARKGQRTFELGFEGFNSGMYAA